MSSLWSRLKTAMGHASAQTRSEWENVKKLGLKEGKNRAKNAVLAIHVVHGENWEEHAAKACRTIRTAEVKENRSSWKYKGELIQIHGQEEFDEFAAKNKWETKVDDQGDTLYRKRENMSSSIIEKEDKATISKRQKLSEDDYAKVEESMNNWGRASGSGPQQLQLGGRVPQRGRKEPKEPKEPVVKTDDQEALDNGKKMQSLLSKQALTAM